MSGLGSKLQCGQRKNVLPVPPIAIPVPFLHPGGEIVTAPSLQVSNSKCSQVEESKGEIHKV